MARKRYKPEEIVGLLRQAEVLHGQCIDHVRGQVRDLGTASLPGAGAASLDSAPYPSRP